MHFVPHYYSFWWIHVAERTETVGPFIMGRKTSVISSIGQSSHKASRNVPFFFLAVRIQTLSMARDKRKLSERRRKNRCLGGPILIQLIRHLSC